jgi:hypothetical protein
MHRLLPIFALALSLTTGWWGALKTATTTALGLQPPTAVEQPSSPHPPSTQGGCSIDPWGSCPGG